MFLFNFNNPEVFKEKYNNFPLSLSFIKSFDYAKSFPLIASRQGVTFYPNWMEVFMTTKKERSVEKYFCFDTLKHFYHPRPPPERA